MKASLVFRTLGAAALLAALSAAPAMADDASPSPSPSTSADGGPTQVEIPAGTTFLAAPRIDPQTVATASASTGDYLYWSFAADAGKRPTVHVTVTLPDQHAAQTWQVDVYDGLRRRQPCRSGAQTHTASADAGNVVLSCTLRTVRAWAEPWDDAPLPGTYYVRATTTTVEDADLGRPVSTEVSVDTTDAGASADVDGRLSAPLVPGVALRTPAVDPSASPSVDSGDSAQKVDHWISRINPDEVTASSWWTGRWVWTGVGAVLAALAGIAGYGLTRGSGRPSREL